MSAPDEAAAPREGSRAIVIVDRDLCPATAARLCASVGALLRGGAVRVLSCDVSALTAPDLLTLDVLARLQLVARREGAVIELRDASDELRGLLVLSGLEQVLPTDGAQSSGSD